MQCSPTIPLLTRGHHCIKKAKVKKQKEARLAAEILKLVIGGRGVGARLLWAQHMYRFPPRLPIRAPRGGQALARFLNAEAGKGLAWMPADSFLSARASVTGSWWHVTGGRVSQA